MTSLLYVALCAASLPSEGAVAVAAQPEIPRRNAVFVEGLGSGGLYSLNYERTVGAVGLRGGLSYAIIGSRQSLFGAPVTAVYLLGKNQVRVEMGAGVTLFHGTDGPTSWWTYGATAILGLRYTSPSGVLFRLTFTPVFVRADRSGGTFAVGPWGGASAGYAF
jgi:hypothetical protein